MKEMMKKNLNILSVILMGAALVAFSSCTKNDDAPTPVTDDALALLPGDTPVAVFQTRASDEGAGSTATPACYAREEIHDDKNVDFTMWMPGGSTSTTLALSAAFKDLAVTEPFSTLMLKDFNVVEGNDNKVSRWTVLHASNAGHDNLFGWARLKADAVTGRPVLDYGEMTRAETKVTIVVNDENGDPVDVSGGKVSATLSLPKTHPAVIYAEPGAAAFRALNDHCSEITTLEDDDEIEAGYIGLATCVDPSSQGNTNFSLLDMVAADGTSAGYGTENNTLSAIVSPTATHTTDGTTYTAIAETEFTDSEQLTITVNDDPDGSGPLTIGRYTLKLSDVKISATESLSAFERGKHYTLTITLKHNVLVSATATIAVWNELDADVDLRDDDAKLPPSSTASNQ